MTIPRPKRIFRSSGLSLVGVLTLALLLAIIINRPWFDEALRPELAALQSARPPTLNDNVYVAASGFLAADSLDPAVVGQHIIQRLHERYELGQAMTVSPPEMDAMLGGSTLDAGWQSQFRSLDCYARVHTDCAERLIAEVVADASPPQRLSVLLARYEALLRLTRFDEGQERDAATPFPPYSVLRDVGRIRLAVSYRQDTPHVFLDNVRHDYAMWLLILRDGEALATKMVALAGMQNDLDFLSTLMRTRVLDAADLRAIQGFVRPFTKQESDIGEAFVSEARTAVLSKPHPMIAGTSWLTRLMLQRNATLNEEYATVFAPMFRRAALSPEQYFAREGYEPLPYRLNVWWPPLYNLGGKLARLSAWPDVQQFVARVHDQDGRNALVSLQAEIAQHPGISLEDVVQRSESRNPYTHEPLSYDTGANTIGFVCLHTIFHPPRPPDVCKYPIGVGLPRH
jgi:hypothetical protein